MESIHRRRRWFYVLWGVLFLVSLAALALWETPARNGSAKLHLRLKVKELPGPVDVRVWVGPHRRWPGAAWMGQHAIVQFRSVDGNVDLDALTVPVAYRRWVKDIIPRRTADLVVLRFEAPGQAPRYLPLALNRDWRTGLLRPGRMVNMSTACTWNGLWTDPSGFSTRLD